MKKFSYSYGFHLLEVMIVIVIISLLSVISVPIYQHAIMRTHRLHAEAILYQVSVALEEYYFMNGTYQHATLNKLHVHEDRVRGYYHILLSSLTDSDYLLMAQPTQASVDSACGTLTLNSKGKIGSAGFATVEECWNQI